MNKWMAPMVGVLISAGLLVSFQLGASNASAPVESPAVSEQPAPPVAEVPEPQPLPTATTVIGAVVAGLSAECSSVNSTITNPSNWSLWDPNAVNYLGYWEVAANSTRGTVVLHVTPVGDVITITPYVPLAQEAFVDATLAFEAWGCPAQLTVKKVAG